jgi:hypothetical protein
VDELFLSWHTLPDVVCISEHWLQEGESVVLQDFDCMGRYNRSLGLGGGVCIFINNALKSSYAFRNCLDIAEFSVEGHVELVATSFSRALACSSNARHFGFVIFCAYRPPSGDLSIFFDSLERVLSRLFSYEKNVVMCGDLNIDLSVVSYNSKRLHSLLASFNIYNKVDFLTRVTQNSSSLIDVMCTNIDTVKCVPFDNGLSDHDAQILTITIPRSTSVQAIRRRNFSKKNVSTCTKLLKSTNWSFVNDSFNFNEKFDRFHTTVCSVFDSAFPFQTMKNYNPNNIDPKGWVSLQIKAVSSLNRDLSRIVKFSNDPCLKSILRARKSSLRSLIRREKAKYFGGLIDQSSKKMRTMWNIVKLHTGNGHCKQKMPDKMFHDGKILISSVEVVKAFNAFFTVLPTPTRLDVRVNLNNIKYDLERFNHNVDLSFSQFQPTSPEEILKALFSLKITSSYGDDGISCKLLRQIIFPILNPLNALFNDSLKHGIFPDVCKIAKVMPLYKRGDASLVHNYRPISLLNTFGKIL